MAQLIKWLSSWEQKHMSFYPWEWCKYIAVVVYTCTPRAEQVERGRFLQLTSQPSRHTDELQVQWETLPWKILCGKQRKRASAVDLWPTHTRTYTLMNTCTHNEKKEKEGKKEWRKEDRKKKDFPLPILPPLFFHTTYVLLPWYRHKILLKGQLLGTEKCWRKPYWGNTGSNLSTPKWSLRPKNYP